MSAEDIKIATLAGLLNDIGKFTTPEAILFKPSSLTTDEFAIMKNHTSDGYSYLIAQEIDPIGLFPVQPQHELQHYRYNTLHNNTCRLSHICNTLHRPHVHNQIYHIFFRHLPKIVL